MNEYCIACIGDPAPSVLAFWHCEKCHKQGVDYGRYACHVCERCGDEVPTVIYKKVVE